MHTTRRILPILALLLGSSLAVATPITSTFEATVTSGPYAGMTGTGWFRYDDAFLVFGDEALGPFGTALGEPGLLDFRFDFLGQTFGMTDDFEYPDLPLIGFFGHEPDFIDFLVEDTPPSRIADPLVVAFNVAGALVPDPRPDIDFSTEMFVTLAAGGPVPLPEPGTLALLAPGLLAVGAVLRRRKKAAVPDA